MPDHTPPQNDTCQLTLMPSGRRGKVRRGTDLLTAARQLGVELESICGGRQTCGKCQVIVEQGHFPKHAITSASDHLSPPTAAEIAYGQEHPLDGRRLACAAEVLGDLLVSVPEESQARKQIIAKAASDRVIEIDPAVRQVYVEVQPAALGDSRGDWERLVTALEAQWHLSGLSIDGKALPTLQPALQAGNHAVTVTLWQEREVLRIQPGYQEGVYGLAVDVGSTTVVAHLCDLRTGVVLATQAAMNPQVRYGEDLMSRVSYAISEPQGLARLNRAIIRTLNELASQAAATAGITSEDILDMVVVGNSIMHHILLGIHPRELGGAPFALAVDSPLDLKARDLGLDLHPAARLHTLPLIAGHVGADNVAVQLAERPDDQDQIMLIVDVGTNAEIVLGDRQQVLVASSPTGPAFEGAQITHGQRAAPGAIERVRIDPLTLEPRFRVIGYDGWIGPDAADSLPPEAKATGICGSGIIEAIAELFLAGVINSSGLFERGAAERSSLSGPPRLRYHGRTGEYVLVDTALSATGSPIVITQNDVRAIQLAKAALYAGAKLLMAERGVNRVERIVLAGAFGSFINPLHALVLGLIPDCPLDRVVAVGNAAGDGARFALLNRKLRIKAAELARWAVHVSTPLSASFQDEFVAALGLPHASDPFPTLEGILPDISGERKNKHRNRIREKLRPLT
ncbi:MAG TPA: ASKHA domain-containing protein [Anaerolineales bacterium]|nr:ASKHA domain-containing protein [Anaerolineales bacterium]